jgi:cysteinyl-tRNA synthetase
MRKRRVCARFGDGTDGMELKLYNTLTRSKEVFRPIDPDNVRMYVCGPTVYDQAHIGNARPVIVFDVLFRLLRHLASQGVWDGGKGQTEVTYVRNITDVDDKINARAARDHPDLPLNEAIRKVTEATNARFQADVKALGCLEPTSQPRATEHIDGMKAMIERLVTQGVAYVAEGHVLFSPSAMNARRGPRYGALSRRPFDEMLAGARVDVASYKRDEMDFVLWKPSKEGEPGWPSPAGIEGLGRPGWHIECSAMSMAKLLEPFGGGLVCDDPTRNVFDIHGGGIDLVFPHHENEIAQSCCALGTDKMASIWMHNGFLQVEGRKMSKSEGNFVTIHELLTGWEGYGWPGEALRFNMLRTHYREPIDWTREKLDESHSIIWNWYRRIEENEPKEEYPSEIYDALSDDLNTPRVITWLHRYASENLTGKLSAGLSVLGFSNSRENLRRNAVVRAEAGSIQIAGSKAAAYSSSAVNGKISERLTFIREKNWAEADRIRDELLAQGIQLKDGKDSATGERITTWEVKR